MLVFPFDRNTVINARPGKEESLGSPGPEKRSEILFTENEPMSAVRKFDEIHLRLFHSQRCSVSTCIAYLSRIYSRLDSRAVQV
jgi:hypothetical protein